MKPWLVRVGLGGMLVALGIWAYQALFPGVQTVLRRRLQELASAASIRPNEASLAKLAKSQKVAAFFTTDAQITLDLPGRLPQSLSGREEVLQAALSARSMLKSLKVEFVDVDVTVGPTKDSAVAHFTVKADVPGESTPQVEELEARFQRVEGDWLINQVQNVRTLR